MWPFYPTYGVVLLIIFVLPNKLYPERSAISCLESKPRRISFCFLVSSFDCLFVCLVSFNLAYILIYFPFDSLSLPRWTADLPTDRTTHRANRRPHSSTHPPISIDPLIHPSTHLHPPTHPPSTIHPCRPRPARPPIIPHPVTGYLKPGGIRALSASVCLSVCLSVSLPLSFTQARANTSQRTPCRSPHRHVRT